MLLHCSKRKGFNYQGSEHHTLRKRKHVLKTLERLGQLCNITVQEKRATLLLFFK